MAACGTLEARRDDGSESDEDDLLAAAGDIPVGSIPAGKRELG